MFYALISAVTWAGVLDLGRGGRRTLAALLGHRGRERYVEAALRELVRDGCVQINGQTLAVPNFLEAQESKASNAARQRKFKERRRELLAAGLDPGEVTRRYQVTPKSNASGNATYLPTYVSQPVLDLGAPADAVPAEVQLFQADQKNMVPSLPSFPGEEVRKEGKEFALWANRIRLEGGLSPAPASRDYAARYARARAEGVTDEELRQAFADFIGSYERPGWGLEVDPRSGKERNASLSLFFGGKGHVWRVRVEDRREALAGGTVARVL